MDEELESRKLLAFLQRSREAAETLLQDNDRLRLELDRQKQQAQILEREIEYLRNRLDPERQASDDIEEEMNAISNLHVATSQLHSSMDVKKVVAITLEICLNLVGAQTVVVYLQDEDKGLLVPVGQTGKIKPEELPVGEGVVGKAVASGKAVVRPNENPMAVVPLRFSERTVGAVVIHDLLRQKNQLTELDHEIFDLLGQQGATALLSAYLAGVASKKLTAVEIRKAFGV